MSRKLNVLPMIGATRNASDYAKESALRKVLVFRMSISGMRQRSNEALQCLFRFLLRCLQNLQLTVCLLLRRFQLNQHFHAGQNELSNRRYFAVMLINPLFECHFLSLPDSIRLSPL